MPKEEKKIPKEGKRQKHKVVEHTGPGCCCIVKCIDSRAYEADQPCEFSDGYAEGKDIVVSCSGFKFVEKGTYRVEFYGSILPSRPGVVNCKFNATKLEADVHNICVICDTTVDCPAVRPTVVQGAIGIMPCLAGCEFYLSFSTPVTVLGNCKLIITRLV